MKGIQDPGQPASSTKGLLSTECAEAVYDICVSEGLLLEQSVDLDASEGSVERILDSNMPALYQGEYSRNRGAVVETILHSRYSNLYKLLRVSDT